MDLDASTALPPAGEAAAPAPASVLAVIGDPSLRDFLLELAIDRGYGVYCADGALEALGVLGREGPGAVLVDLDMPNGAGVRFLDVFRRLRRHPRVVCIAVTANVDAIVPPEIEVLQPPAMDALAALLARHFDL